MAETQFLVQRRQGWYVRIAVPPSLRTAVGKQHLLRSLKTRSLAVAKARRWKVLAELKATLQEARAEHDGDPVVTEALGWRESFEAARRDSRDLEGGPDDPDPVALVDELFQERAHKLHAANWADGKRFAAVATGRATPLKLYLATWLAEGGRRGQFAAKTRAEHERAVEELATWMAAEKITQSLEAVDRLTAGRFVSEHLIPSNRAEKTLAKIVSGLSSYWSWLRLRGKIPDDGRSPWAQQGRPRKAGSDTGEPPRRAFEDEELLILLKGPASPLLADFMRVAALSGLRRGEIGALTAADCKAGFFRVQRGKTAAARRRIPIHSGLVTLVERRTAGKAATAYLFDELPGQGVLRADAIGKAFGRYREKLGVDAGTSRQSATPFHSLRHWFNTAAINAGQPPHVVSYLMGHAEGRQGMTLGRYWSGAGDETLRDVVEAVRLPE